MSSPLKLVTLDTTAALDIPGALRRLASSIERGDFDDAHNLAWVIDCGDGRIEAGVLGQVSEPAPKGYWLFGLAQRKIENSDNFT